MFKAGFALMAIVAVLAVVSTLVRTENTPGGSTLAVQGEAEAVTVTPPAQPVVEEGMRSALLEHWASFNPVLERLEAARDRRDLDALVAVHLELIERIEEMPQPGTASGAAERELHLAYSSTMNAYEDAADDLVHGVRDDDPVEWSEGNRELRIADGQMEMLLRRMGYGAP